MPAVHSRDEVTACPSGWSSSSPRAASETWVTGLTFTQACSQPGRSAVGTKTLLAKVSGKISRNAKPWTLPGLLASMPTRAAIQQTAKENSTISPLPASRASGPPWGRKPRMAPKPPAHTPM